MYLDDDWWHSKRRYILYFVWFLSLTSLSVPFHNASNASFVILYTNNPHYPTLTCSSKLPFNILIVLTSAEHLPTNVRITAVNVSCFYPSPDTFSRPYIRHSECRLSNESLLAKLLPIKYLSLPKVLSIQNYASSGIKIRNHFTKFS